MEPRWRPEYFPCYPNLVDRYDISISQITMIFFTFYVDVSFLYHCQDFYRYLLYIWVTRLVSYKKQELLILQEHLSSPPVFFCGFRVAYKKMFSYYASLCSELHVVIAVTISAYKWCSFRLYLQLFVGRLLSYCYLCLVAYIGVQHILCCVFALFFFVLYTLCCQFLLIIHFWLPKLYSLTFI